MQTEKVGLPAIPETEQIMYKALRQLREKRTLSAPSVMNATVDPTGTMVVGLTPRGLIRFWRSADGQLIDTYQLEANGPSQTFGINWSPDGQRLAIGAGERTAILIPCSRPKLRPIFPACSSTDNDQLNWLGGSGVLAGPGKFSKDGRSFITGNWRSRARLWSLDSGSYTDLGVETAFPWAAALSPDMQKAVVGTSRGTVEIVDIKTRQIVELKLGEAEKSAVTSVDFGNDPNILVAATQSGNLWLLNLAKGISVQVTGQTGIAFQTAFSGDGKRIATTSDDGALRMWLVDNIKDEPFVLRGHERPTYSVHFTDDGSRLISASPDGTVRIWSVYGALHHEMKPMHQPNSVSESPTHFADDQEVARAQAGDYTVVAYSGPHRHLALFHTDHVSAELREQPAPTSEWADRIHVNWRAVGLKSPDPSKKDGKGTISAVATTGETYTWPYFTDIASLTRFADEALPSFDGRKAELPENERCKLDLVELANTSNAPTGGGIGACREAGE
jgi:WD40 repeat protein